MLADYEMSVRSLGQEISAADAESEAGLGKEYTSASDLLNDIMSEG